MSMRILKLGTITGLVGGTVMAAFAMVALGVTGKGFLTPVNLFANTFWADAPTTGRFVPAALLLGVGIHLVVSIIVGTLIAVLVERGSLDTGAVFMVAIGVGTCAFVGQAIFWPALDSDAHAAFAPWALASAHAVFAVFAALAIQRLERKTDPQGAVLTTA